MSIQNKGFKMRDRFLRLILVLGLVMGCRFGEREDGQIVFKAVDDHNLEYPTTRGLMFIGNYLEERTGGRLKLVIYHSAQLGSEKETIEQTQFGAIDINRVNVNPVAQVSKSMLVLAMPYIFRDVEHMHKVLDGEIGERLLRDLEQYGLIGLGYYDAGFRSFYNSQRAIEKPSDLKGLKIRVQHSRVMIDTVKALGASPAPMSFEEVYTGLQTGLIQGAENNFPSYYYTRHYEVARYYSIDEHCAPPEVVLFSKKSWERLSGEERELIRGSVKASVEYQRALWLEFEARSREELEKSRVEINRIEDKRSFIDAIQGVYEKYEQDPELAELVQAIKAVE